MRTQAAAAFRHHAVVGRLQRRACTPFSAGSDGLLGVGDALSQQGHQSVQAAFQQGAVVLQTSLNRLQRSVSHLEVGVPCMAAKFA